MSDTVRPYQRLAGESLEETNNVYPAAMVQNPVISRVDDLLRHHAITNAPEFVNHSSKETSGIN